MPTDTIPVFACLRILALLGRGALLAAACATGFLTTGCATTNGVAASKNDSTAPDPEWYQSNDNVFHAD